jgi:hypothetical protein
VNDTTSSPPNQAADAPPSPRATLWAAAREALRFMQTLFGGPAAIAALVWVVGARRAEMLAWLAPVEALLRKLVALEAASLSVSPPMPRTPPVGPGARRPRGVIDIETPQNWPARFRVSASQERRRDAGPATPPRTAGAPNFDGLYGAFPLAARLEAALRVMENPAPYAQRLARRLARSLVRAPNLLAALARQGRRRRCDACHGPCGWALDEAGMALMAAACFSADTS